jgi:hypothetical protein
MTLVFRTPGYSAEIALERSGTCYASPQRRTLGGGAVAPQALARMGGRVDPGGCNPTCLCVTGEGCPCCMQMPAPELMGTRSR